MKATWNGAVLAASDDTVIVESQHYFPENSLQREFFSPSESHSECHWKGTASYYNITVAGETNPDAAWYYPDPKPEAAQVKGRVAFWRGVKVEP